MIDFAGRILLLSVMISLITAGLVFLSLNALMVRPMRRITASMMAFRRDPEDPAATLPQTSRADEIGMAQRELIDMQASLRAALRQKERLAALGTAVTKINHGLRNILPTAALVSEASGLQRGPGGPPRNPPADAVDRPGGRAVQPDPGLFTRWRAAAAPLPYSAGGTGGRGRRRTDSPARRRGLLDQPGRRRRDRGGRPRATIPRPGQSGAATRWRPEPPK